MECKGWTEKLDAYLDGELSLEEARTAAEHLRGCSSCSLQAVERLQQKRMVQLAGQRFAPEPRFRERVVKRLENRKSTRWNWRWLQVLAAAALVIAAAMIIIPTKRERDQQLVSELVDLHVATLASANPVDVTSSDRHTVKPWFQGKIPFTFNLPELQGSPFTLVGGRISYLRQSPGAELIYRIRQHQISVFLFQERELGKAEVRQERAPYFGVRSWTQNGLRYFLVGDAGAQDLNALAALLKSAG